MSSLTQEDIDLQIAKVIEEKGDTLILSRIEKGLVLPKSIIEIPNLRKLSIIYSYGVDIPSWLADITTLETLNLEDVGNVSAFMPHIGKLEQLRELQLTHMDGVLEFPPTVKNLRNLKELNIDGAYCEKFPKELILLENLESLSYIYCECELSDVFSTLSQMKNLKKLYFATLSMDDHESLPDSFVDIHSLEEIHFVEWLRLDGLPENIDKMQSLRVIDLCSSDAPLMGYDSNIKSLPESIGNLKNLEELDIFGCLNITRLPNSFKNISTLKRIDIIDSGIADLRLTDEQWGGLESLRMQGVQPDFSKCVNLKTLAWCHSIVSYAYNGKVSGIEDDLDLPIACLHNLENLRIHGGTLKNLDFLDEMPKLRSLSLSCNFSRLPDSLGKMNDLESLSIFGAVSLTTLPPSIADLPSLKELHIMASGVKAVPDFLKPRKDMRIDIRRGALR